MTGYSELMDEAKAGVLRFSASPLNQTVFSNLSIKRAMAEQTSLSDTKPSSFPIVGVGATAGGLEALEELFANTPVNIGMAFVVVTHQHPTHTSMLPELLARNTKLPVLSAEDGMALEPNHVYVAPPGTHMALLNESLHFMDATDAQKVRLPIDYFFRSLAEDKKKHSIGIILSGTATDGTLGIKAIKGESGMAMVQEPTSAKYSGMPSSAIATGCVDFILPPEKMAEQLASYANGAYISCRPEGANPVQMLSEEPLQKIFLLLRSRTGNDFSSYKKNTICRRIERRMNVHQIENPNQYVRYLQENPHEIDILFKEMLISVTSFFRDPEAYETLAKGALLELLRSRPNGYHLRIWVPGCATGEEAYSIAILVDECMRALSKHFEVQIFGTDLDASAVETGRSGIYPGGIAIDVNAERLKRYFSHEDHVCLA
jgi:two-component system CheB/CheR fusion protein